MKFGKWVKDKMPENLNEELRLKEMKEDLKLFSATSFLNDDYIYVMDWNNIPILGYKALPKDMTAIGGFKYEMHKVYTLDTTEQELTLCRYGFHYCKNVIDCDFFYSLGNSRVFEIMANDVKFIVDAPASGMVPAKFCTDKIILFHEMTSKEIKERLELELDLTMSNFYSILKRHKK